MLSDSLQSPSLALSSILFSVPYHTCHIHTNNPTRLYFYDMQYIPKDFSSVARVVATGDSPEREVEFMPSKTPYDPRHMLAGG